MGVSLIKCPGGKLMPPPRPVRRAQLRRPGMTSCKTQARKFHAISGSSRLEPACAGLVSFFLFVPGALKSNR